MAELDGIHIIVVCVQDRLMRCSKQCHDEYHDSLPSLGKEKAEAQAEACLVKCCDTNSKLIPTIFAKLRSNTKNCH